jgi:hypothetical protein
VVEGLYERSPSPDLLQLQAVEILKWAAIDFGTNYGLRLLEASKLKT